MADQNGQIHNEVAELLSAYIDDEVSADERALVEAHLTICTTCAQDLTILRRTVALLGELPQMAAPRPFTLRESDVRPVPSPARPAWWQLPWVRGLAAATAMLLCVVVVVGVVLLGQGAMVGAPAVSERLAMEVPATTEVTSQEVVAEKVVEEAETVLEAEKEEQEAVEPAALPPAPQEATAESEMMQEAPAEAAPAEEKAVADEGEQLMAAESDRAAAGAARMPTATPAPMLTATPAPIPTTTPAVAAQAMPAVAPTPTPTLLEVEDLSLEVEPGVIRASGRVPLPEGRKLLVALWRDGQPLQWATVESRQLVIEADGQFSLALVAQSGIPSFNLLAAEPAYYEIRIRPVDPPAPVEIRIYFDTYGPPPPVPTSTP